MPSTLPRLYFLVHRPTNPSSRTRADPLPAFRMDKLVLRAQAFGWGNFEWRTRRRWTRCGSPIVSNTKAHPRGALTGTAREQGRLSEP